MTKILTQNVCKWRTAKLDEFCHFLANHQADIYAFTEHLGGSNAERVKAFFYARGYEHHYEILSTNRRKGSLLTVSKTDLLSYGELEECEEKWRFQSFSLTNHYLSVVYWPNSEAKVPYWEGLLSYLRQHKDKPHIILGDFNTGENHLDRSEKGALFVATEYLEKLFASGHQDAWRYKNGSTREYSWYSNAGNGFRLDHIFVSKSLISGIIDCAYDHQPQSLSYSDHSCMWLEFDQPLFVPPHKI